MRYWPTFGAWKVIASDPIDVDGDDDDECVTDEIGENDCSACFAV